MQRALNILLGSDALIGITYKALSVLGAASVVALAKALLARYPLGEILFFRSLFMLIPVLIAMSLDARRFSLLRTTRPLLHLTRSLIGTTTIALTYAVLIYLPIGDATALNFLSPLILVAMAAFILREKVGWYRITAVILGFIGIVLIASPHALSDGGIDQDALIGVALGILTAFSIACSQLMLRSMRIEPALTTVFYFTLVMATISGLTLPFAYHAPASLTDLGLLIATGILGGLAQICVTQGYRYADASLLAPIDYSQIAWALLFGFFIFAEVPTPMALLGTVLVCGSGIAIALREQRLARPRMMAVKPSDLPPEI